ncbi:hypothetical protein NDU88_005936 [Pleurodeles waltl]|uniref:Uncharacterized protein n=1 Tax=Pleurodeles waltl TaxID=8319 RepID=A0AAV7LML8_PLEWA|nr:hypothetical protein NDU88_005936 [Pleurodeles waltl]
MILFIMKALQRIIPSVFLGEFLAAPDEEDDVFFLHNGHSIVITYGMKPALPFPSEDPRFGSEPNVTLPRAVIEAASISRVKRTLGVSERSKGWVGPLSEALTERAASAGRISSAGARRGSAGGAEKE